MCSLHSTIIANSSSLPPSLPPSQIFFHYSELSSGMEADITVGSAVEFIVQNRQVQPKTMCIYCYMRMISSSFPHPLPLSFFLSLPPSLPPSFLPPSKGKEVATQLKILPPGSVQFDDVATEEFQGAVKQPVIRSFTHGRGKEAEPITGEIIYQSDVEG